MSFREKSDICSTHYKERDGSFTIIGIWKYQPSESYGFIQSFRPDNPQIIYNYNETAFAHNESCPSKTPHKHDCPLLSWHLQDGGAKILSLDPKYDGPASRFQIYTLPDTSMRGIKQPGVTMYQVSNAGMIVNIKGEKQKGYNPPGCYVYENYNRQITIGSFGISDNVLPNGEMKGSASWRACGHPFQDKMGFGVGRMGKYAPSKKESCPSEEDVFIQVNWRFYLIK